MRIAHLIGLTAFIIFLMRVGVNAAEKSEEITINSFLLTAKYDYSLENHQELLDYLETASSSTPYIDKIEFRSSSEDFEIAKQKYALRFYPKGWGETKYNNKLAESIIDAYTVEHEVYFNLALKKRYILILEYFESFELRRIMHELLAVYDDRMSVLKAQTGTLAFDVSEYIAEENLYTELQLDMVKIENKITGIIHKIHLAADTEAEVSFRDRQLVDVEEIIHVVSSLEFDPELDNIYLMDRKNRIARARIKYNIEKARDRDFLSYLQLEYDGDNYKNSEKAYSIDLGFKLPFINPDREDINRRKVNYIEEKLKYEEGKRATSEKIKSILRSLNRLFSQDKLLAERRETGDASNPLETYMKMEGIDPLYLLDIRESMINNDKQQSQIYYMSLYKYIELIDLTGKLCDRPLRNFILKGMGPIHAG